MKAWSGGAMVLGKLSVPGRPTTLNNSRTRAYCVEVGADGDCLDILFLFLPPLSARYRLKYCLKWQLNPKQPTDQ